MKPRGQKLGPVRAARNGAKRQTIARTRQAAAHANDRANDPTPGVAVTSFTRDYPKGAQIAAHLHGSDQLIYASAGVMQIAAANRRWILPPQFALWIPARVVHEVRMPEPVSLRTLYLRAGLASLGDDCVVLHVTPLLRELLFETVRLGKLRVGNKVECALRDLLVAQLGCASPMPTGIRLPLDKRAVGVADAILGEPGLRTPLTELCRSAGLGVRTFERTFRKEVGMSFETWRRHVRLMRAIELLVAGRSVKEVAFAVGYQEPSAFVALFRETFGTTPKAWAASLQAR
jgi:AraC-like DNA-binding protein/quercetin dioxygenase-like cupin family protein